MKKRSIAILFAVVMICLATACDKQKVNGNMQGDVRPTYNMTDNSKVDRQRKRGSKTD